MSSYLKANYPNRVPAASDVIIYGQSTDNADVTANWSASMQQFATLFQSLANLNLKPTIIAVDTTLIAQQLIIVDSINPVQLALPDNSLNSGRGFRIFNKGAGLVTIVPAGSDTIAGASTKTLAQFASTTLYSDAIGMWAVFG